MNCQIITTPSYVSSPNEDHLKVRKTSPTDEVIHNFVTSFLAPYVYNTGYVSQEEASRRSPMFENLMTYLNVHHCNVEQHLEEIQDTALRTYLYESARSIYIYVASTQYYLVGKKRDKLSRANSHLPVSDVRIQPAALQLLIQALIPALKIDFPKLSFSEAEIAKKATEAVATLSDERIKAFEDAKLPSTDFDKIKRIRQKKIKMLKNKINSLFFSEDELAIIYQANPQRKKPYKISLLPSPESDFFQILKVSLKTSNIYITVKQSHEYNKYHEIFKDEQGRNQISIHAFTLAHMAKIAKFKNELSSSGWCEFSENPTLKYLGWQFFYKENFEDPYLIDENGIPQKEEKDFFNRSLAFARNYENAK